ncbi:exodeoxyribonuclease VII large subunit [Marinospirillum perlucidum]|uniref:exodeoxyribonuclease VII large subunit n=1 Tax=Marinospirillum perlucidum TaxID=1982602 RepID=UPI000DF3ABE3|nr:exodeoxyribonuclease VII large subunit [Marinospirillum perlucidum]
MPSSFLQVGDQQDLIASLSVSQVNQKAKQLLEQGLASIWVEGEVSNFMASAAGHWYFTLKDERAQISCVMFAGRNQLVAHRVANGDQLQVRGQVSLYEGRGQYQLLADRLRPCGDGDLLARLEALKKKLGDEGLFAQDKKRPLPEFPQRIGLITSPHGAALRDLLKVLKSRWPLAEILLYPAQVQGAEAPAALRRALALAQYHGHPEVLILARGGGSLEDLQAFNDETLARMVAASAMPVVTGVGHETDFTLVDFVSDWRAPTPSAAAERVTPDGPTINARLTSLQGRLVHAQATHLRSLQQRLDQLVFRARQPQRYLEKAASQLQSLQQRLQTQHPQRQLQLRRQQLVRLDQRLAAAHPGRYLLQQQRQLAALQQRFQLAWQHLQTRREQKLQQAAQQLQAISPLQTLARGYALAKNDQGQLVRSSTQVQTGDLLEIQLAEGWLDCRVENSVPKQT